MRKEKLDLLVLVLLKRKMNKWLNSILKLASMIIIKLLKRYQKTLKKDWLFEIEFEI